MTSMSGRLLLPHWSSAFSGSSVPSSMSGFRRGRASNETCGKPDDAHVLLYPARHLRVNRPVPDRASGTEFPEARGADRAEPAWLAAADPLAEFRQRVEPRQILQDLRELADRQRHDDRPR